ncbi:MAG TPA: hypothetical protein VMD47_08160 [Candidatus Acidoferrales bacterium]|nr:hypothetical protein [Candidatus Acidoferrales bacterium]
MIGLLAALIIAGVPISAPAQSFSPAPADEYFGPHHQSILEIRNRLDRLDGQTDRELIDENATAELDDIAASISDWRRQYPQDPWLPRAYARLLRDYHRCGASSSDRAMAMLAEMKAAFPDAPETSGVIAMIYGGASNAATDVADDAPVAPPPYQAPVYQAPAYQPAPVYQPPPVYQPAPVYVLPSYAVPVSSGAWARFDAMRPATTSTTRTTVTTSTTTTTTTSSGGP